MINIEGKDYLPLADLIGLMNIDPKTAKQKAGENNIPLYKNAPDGRVVTICKEDIPRLIFLFPKKITDENREKIRELIGEIPGNFPPIPDIPDIPNNSPKNNPNKKEVKNPVKNGMAGYFLLGEKIGDFYASNFFAYTVLSLILIIQAILHAQAAAWFLPFLHFTELWIIVSGIQMVVLVGTMHSRKFGGNNAYWLFLTAFAIYDAVMNACNFFREYQWPAYPTLGDYIGIIIRLTLTFGFSLATVYYAILIKKIRNV